MDLAQVAGDVIDEIQKLLIPDKPILEVCLSDPALDSEID